MKSFLGGLVTGIVVTIVTLYVIGLAKQDLSDDDPIQYLEIPVSYENKTETSFKVFQVLGAAALAKEISNRKYKWYNGNTVVILGENYYSDQIITVKNPQRVGTYSYTTKGGMPMTVPVIDGDISE
ncbi:MAG: VPDSG-CTERM exosortase interaction domain protein [Prevotellaceae bacterium]|nr:VPDSG-CTERM exosortase interaction domain protein [Prevotellaceae bacterium]MDO4932916.1 VPDSG-CTERM exosortase interaction domain protein [Prevotellaceae bacterium]